MKSLIFKILFLVILFCPVSVLAQQKLGVIDGEPQVLTTLDQELERIFTTVIKPENLLLQYVEVETPDGHPVMMVRDENRLTLINYWAAWCTYCIIELPDLMELQKRHPEIGIMYIGDNKSSSIELRDMMKRVGLPSDKTFFDSRGFLKRSMNLKAVPVTLIIDRKGHVLYHLEGSIDWDLPIIEKMLEEVQNRAKWTEKIEKNN